METSFRRPYAAAREALDEVLSFDGGSVDARKTGASLWSAGHFIESNPALLRALTDPSRNGADRAGLAEKIFTSQITDAGVYVVKAAVSQRWATSRDLLTALDRLGVTAVLVHAERQRRIGQVEDEMFRFARLVEGTPELQAAFSEPRAGAGAKAALVDRLLSVKAAPETIRLVAQATSGVRGRSFQNSVADYLDQAAALQDQITATVTTAVPLSEQQLERLEAALSAQYGRQVHTNIVIDPTVVGGLRVEIGDDVIDGTIDARLADARRQLTS